VFLEKINCAHNKLVELHKLVPNPKNPNKHPDKQIEMLAKIIDYQGQRSPIVVSNRSGFVIKGHGRLEAIKKLGWKKCAVDYQDYEDEAQEFADMIADNKIAELAEHDDGASYN
jgi:ParB-like chromosome segregation protein Spo0J